MLTYRYSRNYNNTKHRSPTEYFSYQRTMWEIILMLDQKRQHTVLFSKRRRRFSCIKKINRHVPDSMARKDFTAGLTRSSKNMTKKFSFNERFLGGGSGWVRIIPRINPKGCTVLTEHTITWLETCILNAWL